MERRVQPRPPHTVDAWTTVLNELAAQVITGTLSAGEATALRPVLAGLVEAVDRVGGPNGLPPVRAPLVPAQRRPPHSQPRPAPAEPAPSRFGDGPPRPARAPGPQRPAQPSAASGATVPGSLSPQVVMLSIAGLPDMITLNHLARACTATVEEVRAALTALAADSRIALHRTTNSGIQPVDPVTVPEHARFSVQTPDPGQRPTDR